VQIAGETSVLTEPADLDAFVTDFSGRYKGNAVCVLRPRRTKDESIGSAAPFSEGRSRNRLHEGEYIVNVHRPLRHEVVRATAKRRIAIFGKIVTA
jgi:hypothetical protein